MTVLIIDNFDSFTYNIAQIVGALGFTPLVLRNDSIDAVFVERIEPSHIIVSPGPGTPSSAGVSMKMIERYAGRIPLLGVCLGHQAIGEVFGGRVVHAPALMHGKVSPVFHDNTGLHCGLPTPFQATRYHSLVLDPGSVPVDLSVNAWTEGGVVMGVSHPTLGVHGIQYHPESIMTGVGVDVIRAFLCIDLKNDSAPTTTDHLGGANEACVHAQGGE